MNFTRAAFELIRDVSSHGCVSAARVGVLRKEGKEGKKGPLGLWNSFSSQILLWYHHIGPVMQFKRGTREIRNLYDVKSSNNSN